MSLLDHELLITNQVPDSVDVHPRGHGCDSLTGGCEFFLDTSAAGFKYRICGRCGTVRIIEIH